TRWAQRPRRTSQPSNPKLARQRFLCHVTQWLKFLGRWQAAATKPSPFAEPIAAFADYLRLERNLSPRTIHRSCWTARRFLHRLGTADGSLHEIRINQVDEALLAMVRQGDYAPATVRTFAFDLRA